MVVTRIGWFGTAPALLLSVVLCSSVFFAGCWQYTSRTKPPDTLSSGKAPTVMLINDPEEEAAVFAMESARADYLNCLKLLQAYYFKIGNLDKERWAGKEYKNVASTRTWEWEGLPPVAGSIGADMNVETEHSLVEPLMSARRDYKARVDAVIKMYEARGGPHEYKARLMVTMKRRLDPVFVYPYFPELQLPPLSLRGTEVIPEAEQLFDDAKALWGWWGGGKIAPAISNYDKQRRALATFMQLVEEYPTSRRIALSAYYIAEIYKEYFKENALCVFWYERAWTWDPHVEEPACFQAATVYDFHLYNFAKAVECYQMSLDRPDPGRLGNRWYAQSRIKALMGQ
ncbi:MAG: hypothetical protein FWE88_06150 [Phycisphaerae bacterium]|nr:hypothetical protein [Phycisphaerae bacterium]